MGSALSSKSSSSVSDANSRGTPVLLNVYDLVDLNNYLIWCGVGVFHSGIEVYGLEYGYGAHDYPTSGVFEVEPRSCPGFTYRCTIILGHIDMSPSEFRSLMESTVADYHGDMYHLIYKNCNHFTDDICLRLTGKHIPGWVNRLASIGAFCSCLLPESLQVPALKEIPEYHPCAEVEDGSESLSVISGQEPTESDDTDQERLLSSSSGGDVAFIKELKR